MRILLLLVIFTMLSAPLLADNGAKVVEVKTADAIMRVGPNEDFDRLTPQTTGTRLAVLRDDGTWYAVRLGPNRTGYIQKSDVTDLSPDTPGPAARLQNIETHPTADGVRMAFTLSQPVAVEAVDEETPSAIRLTFDDTTLTMFEATQPHGTDLVRSITLQQAEDGVVTVTVGLSTAHAWGYRLTRTPKGMWLDIRRAPTGLRGATVVLDPGHGGDDSGAIGRDGLKEKDVNLAVALALRERLEHLGAHVVMTHDTDRSVVSDHDQELAARVQVGRQAQGTIFVSIHHNARPKVEEGRVAHGTWIYFYRPQSRALALSLSEPVAKAIHEDDYGIIWRSFHVIRQTDMPAVLVEVQFISNPAMEAEMRAPAYAGQVADALARGLQRFFAQHG